MRLRKTFVLSAALALLAPRIAAAAPHLDAQFVDRLTSRSGRRHPLADRTGRLPVVVEVPSQDDARAWGGLPLGAGFATLRLLPGELARFEAEHPDASISIWPGLHLVLDESMRRNRLPAYKSWLRERGSPVSGTGKGVVVGIVDTGVDLSHPDLRDADGGTRVAWLLDFSNAPTGRHADLETLYGCNAANQARCSVLEKLEIDSGLAGSAAVTLPSDVQGHGTHVASIAAGNGGVDPRFAGGAPGATLIVAALGSGGADESVADVDVVTATRFIFDRAKELGLPAVVNLSLGSDFGPHDGTSPLERALSELVGPNIEGRSIVVAAGNSGALYRGDAPDQILGIHTEVRVTADVPARLPLFTPDAPKGSQVSGTGYVWLKFSRANDLAVGFDGPNGLSMAPVGMRQTGGAHTADDALQVAVYNDVVRSDTPLTDGSPGAIVVWSGRWPADGKMTIRLEGEGFVNAWVEGALDDVANTGDVYFELATRAGTINVPATSPSLIAVGCTINRTSWIDQGLVSRDVVGTSFSALSPVDSSCYFSSAGGLGGDAKPEISAPGGLVAAAMSRDAVPGVSPFSVFTAPPGLCAGGTECLVVDDHHAILSGTSMSSPQVAGAIALLFEHDAKLSQPDVLELLRAGARRPTGSVIADYQLGIGALDVAGSATTLDARKNDIVREPDAAASWVTLSSNYLHPGSGGITGRISLRAANGEIADHFDEKRLSVAVSGEAVGTGQPAREAPGLYQFYLSALPSTGSTSLRLDVRWDGVTIGAANARLSGSRVIPIGGDRWIASGSSRPYGGCTIVHVGSTGAARDDEDDSDAAGADLAPRDVANDGYAKDGRHAGRDGACRTNASRNGTNASRNGTNAAHDGVQRRYRAGNLAFSAFVALLAVTEGRRRGSRRSRAARTALDRDRTDRLRRDRRR